MTTLIEHARKAADRSYVPYTKHKVGVAIDTDRGTIYGASLENCAHPNSICACHAACVSAIASGATEFRRVAVFNDSDTLEPCGQCLEILSEFTDDIPIEICKGNSHLETSLRKMLPKPMGTSPTCFKTKKSDMKNVPQHFNDYKLSPETIYPDEAFLSRTEFETLCRAALEGTLNCYVPTSHFPVGAALIPAEGTDKIVIAGNTETSIMGCTLCAERSCLARSNSLGNKGVKALAITCLKSPDYGRPCGGCRQSLAEYECYPIYMLKVDIDAKVIHVDHGTTFSILPNAFVPSSLR